MLEPTAPPAPPVRTWRPMALWTAGILLVLGLVLFVCVAAVPFWQARAAVERCRPYDATKAEGEIERLGGPKAAIHKLTVYLRLHGSWAPRRLVAAAILGQCGTDAVPELLRLLKDRDYYVVQSAVDGLWAIKDPDAVPALLPLLKDPDYVVRRAAAKCLLTVKDPRAAGYLAAAVGDENELVRWAAVLALCGIRDPDAAEPGIAALEDEDESVRRAAREVLDAYGETVQVVRKMRRSATKKLASEEIQRLGGEERVLQRFELVLCVGLPRKHFDPTCHCNYVVYSLIACGKPAIPRLLDVMKSPLDRSNWGQQMRAFAAIKDPAAFDALLAMLQDRRADQGRRDGRRLAALGLGLMKDPRAVEPLIAALRDADRLVRSSAARALEDIGDRRAIEPLRALLGDEDEVVRYNAAEALGGLGADARAAVPALEKALADPSELVRSGAARALKKIRGEEPGKP